MSKYITQYNMCLCGVYKYNIWVPILYAYSTGTIERIIYDFLNSPTVASFISFLETSCSRNILLIYVYFNPYIIPVHRT